ncbi:MAG TPA: amino acid permease [Tepidisphaeraceae bacterium]|nr:amino acid permease [Tepidisphaeraceae bacterium]
MHIEDTPSAGSASGSRQGGQEMVRAGDSSGTPKRQLTLFDSTCIIVGIILGASIYESTPSIASNVPSALWLVGIWVIGGVISLIGAMCYAELATTYPLAGGDYVYLTRAFGGRMGFLFAWAQLWVVRPGSVGAMAYVFARYANEMWPLGRGAGALMAYAVGSIVVLTLINIVGAREGKWTQNLLTTVKALGLVVIVAMGLIFAVPSASETPAPGSGRVDFRFALILILYAYGGWNEMAYVAAEVREPQRNILRSLLLGTLAVTLIYVLANVAFVHALGLQGVRNSGAVAADVLRLGLGQWGGRIISLLICLSALGAINGMIFTGARITYAMGTEHRLYAWLGAWNERRGTPVRSLMIQAVITLALVIGFGRTQSGFGSLVNFTTPVFWIFFLLVGASLFVLRVQEPGIMRPYRVPGYPVTPGLFCASSLFMLYASLSYAMENRSAEGLWAIGILLVGGMLCWMEREGK